jgi:hypothetical protein
LSRTAFGTIYPDIILPAQQRESPGVEGGNVTEGHKPNNPSLIDWAGGDRATPAITFTDIVD